MEAVIPSEQTQPVRTEEKRSQQPSCPLCGGFLLPLRGLVRCCRCQFTICEGCAGAENPLDGLD